MKSSKRAPLNGAHKELFFRGADFPVRAPTKTASATASGSSTTSVVAGRPKAHTSTEILTAIGSGGVRMANFCKQELFQAASRLAIGSATTKTDSPGTEATT